MFTKSRAPHSARVRSLCLFSVSLVRTISVLIFLCVHPSVGFAQDPYILVPGYVIQKIDESIWVQATGGVSRIGIGEVFNFGVLSTYHSNDSRITRPPSYEFSIEQDVRLNGSPADVQKLVHSGTIYINPNRAQSDDIVFAAKPAYFSRFNVVLSVEADVGATVKRNLLGELQTNVPLKGRFSRLAPPAATDPQASGWSDSVCLRTTRSGGCATWSVAPMTVSLSLHDLPLSYRPPIGPPIEFHVYYSHRESTQPVPLSYGNHGRRWTNNWTSFVTDDVAAASTATLYMRGGGAETFAFSSSTTSAPGVHSQSTLIRRLDASGRALGFTRQLPDGSKEEFNQLQAGRYFLTAMIDRHGNSVRLSYDGTGRLVSIVDAIGQQTTVLYGSADPLKITRVVDPFGRSAAFAYNASGQLASITDSIGITSSFTYGSSDFITRLTTPYGVTRFEYGDKDTDPRLGTTRWLNVTDALGRMSRIEYSDVAPGVPSTEASVPSGMTVYNDELHQRNTYIWSPDQYAAATASGGLDYTKARVLHWLRSTDPNVTSRVLESSKSPLEGRVWYRYAGQPNPTMIGTSSQPVQVGRILADGKTQLYQYTYNAQGNVTTAADPVGREQTYSYDSTGLDVLRQANTTGSLNQTLVALTYNAQHRPLSVRGANGAATTYEYNAAGQVVKVTDALGRSTAFTYDSRGYLTKAQGALAAATTSFEYDSVGRLAGITGPGGTKVQHAYDDADRLIKTTFADGTSIVYTYRLLDLESITDRMGRTTRLTYDAERQLVQTTDALSQSTRRAYSGSGALISLTDQNGNTTRWVRDLQDRVIQKIYADGKTHTTAYESASSRIASMTDALGQVTSLRHNQDDALAAVTYSNTLSPTPNVSFTYDSSYPRQVSMSDGIGTTSYSYYALGGLGGGRVRTVTSPIAGGSGTDTVTLEYDALDRVSARVVNGSREATRWDEIGRVTEVSNALDTFTYGYSDGTGRTSSMRSAGGPLVAFDYFDGRRDEMLKSLRYSTAAGAQLARFDYTYDASQNVLTFTEAYINQRLVAIGTSGMEPEGPMERIISTAVSAPTGAVAGQGLLRVSEGARLALWMMGLLGIAVAAKRWLSSNRIRWWPAIPVAAALSLSSCGGGEQHPLSVEPKEATSAQRVLLIAASGRAGKLATAAAATDPYGGVDPLQAVDQLLDKVAEPTFPQYFPGHKSTQTFARYRFRYYPETGIYVAVAVGVQAGEGLNESGVYVLGGPFGGTPLYVGLLLDFITPTPVVTGSARVTLYSYDAVDRLLSATEGTDVSPPSGQPKHAYRYDAASNLLSLTTNGVVKSVAYTSTNSIASDEVDANGSPTRTASGWTYRWDAANRLISAVNGAAESRFTYDGNSRLVRIVDLERAAVVRDRSFLWCGLQRCTERDNRRGGSPVVKRFFDQGVVADGVQLHYVSDQLGSVRQLVDRQGQVQAQYAFAPYGERSRISGSAVSDVGFAGLLRHESTGLDFAVFRGYDSRSGRWLNRDPIQETGGLNLYYYSAGNPVRLYDRLGLSPVGLPPLPPPPAIPPPATAKDVLEVVGTGASILSATFERSSKFKPLFAIALLSDEYVGVSEGDPVKAVLVLVVPAVAEGFVGPFGAIAIQKGLGYAYDHFGEIVNCRRDVPDWSRGWAPYTPVTIGEILWSESPH